MAEVVGHMYNMLVGCQQLDSAVSLRESHHDAAGVDCYVEPSFRQEIVQK